MFGMDRGLNSFMAPSNVSIVPRIETRHFELGLPVSFYQLHAMRIGLALRAGPIMIGSDKLGAAFGLTDVGGMDLSIGTKINIGKR